MGNCCYSRKLEWTDGKETISVPVNQFELDVLMEHNLLREKHGCPPLTINKTLTKLATDWANTLSSKAKFYHRPNNVYGENLFWSHKKQPNAKQTVTSWYDEIEDFSFGSGGFSRDTGHFTQLIWKETKEIGCGIAIVDDSVWVVCNYNPPGNSVGEFTKNVPRAIMQ